MSAAATIVRLMARMSDTGGRERQSFTRRSPKLRWNV
jgi:hypothetical protein